MISVVKHEVFMTKYEILKVSKFASREEIQKAYDEQMKEYMVGITGKDTQENAMHRALIRDAYATLINDDKRKEYDQSLRLEANKKIANNEISRDMSFKTIELNFLSMLAGMFIFILTTNVSKFVLPMIPNERFYRLIAMTIIFVIGFYFLRIVMGKIISYVDEGEYNQGPCLYCVFVWANIVRHALTVNELPVTITLFIHGVLLYFIVYRKFAPKVHL